MNNLQGTSLLLRGDATPLSQLARRHETARAGLIPGGLKIAIRDLEFFYGDIKALKNISLDIDDRSVTALVGPSGCGKSTLLRTLNRLYSLYPGQRATGTITMDGRNILDPGTDLEELRANVSMVFQTSTALPMSIYANVALALSVRLGVTRAECWVLVETALREAALWNEVKDILASPAEALSGGQQQRLCIARAIATAPQVLLFDEPCSALDPISTAHIEALINELATRYCVVIVTHNMQQAARVADRTAFMYLGELVEVGKTEQIFGTPKEQRTSDYIKGRFG